METISVVLSVRNEELKIERTLFSLGWADEIIVVDNGSTDKTADIARQYGAKVIQSKNNLMLNVNKNFGFGKAKGSWILSMDGDEVIPPELAGEIKKSVHNSPVVGYWIPRKNILFGKWIAHGLWWPDKQLRLFQRGIGAFPCKHVHEYLAVDGPTAELSVPMVHYNYETVSQFIRKMDEIYTESEVESRVSAGYALVWQDAVRFPMSDFVKTYLAQGGYKDGIHGLILSILQSFYSFIVFVKLWERQKFAEQELLIDDVEKELLRAHREVRYWLLSVKIGETSDFIKKTCYKKREKSYD